MITCEKKYTLLSPVSYEDAVALNKYEDGELLDVVVISPEKAAMHRRLFALAHKIHENCPQVGLGFDLWRHQITEQCRLGSWHEQKDGRFIFKPRSWSPLKIDLEEQEEIYRAIYDYAQQHYWQDWTSEDLARLDEEVGKLAPMI